MYTIDAPTVKQLYKEYTFFIFYHKQLLIRQLVMCRVSLKVRVSRGKT